MNSLLIVGARNGVDDKIVSHSASPTYFDVCFFSFAGCIGVIQLVLGFLSQEVVTCVAVDSVCHGKR